MPYHSTYRLVGSSFYYVAFSQPSFGTDLFLTYGRCLHYSSQASKVKREVIFKRVESYAKEYLSKEKEEIRLK